ncbi:MAG: CDP-glycerol glycerophosphotransferase family protein [Clostridia bacterium]
MKEIVKSSISAILYFLCKFKKIQNNKIIIWSDDFKSYACNPKYITEFILKNYKSQFEVVWVFSYKIDIPKDIPADIKIVRWFSARFLKELYTSKFIVFNKRILNCKYLKKRKNQIYIQTWHSSLRLKCIEKDAEKFLTKGYVKNAKLDSSRTDYIVSGCEFSSNIFRKSFWYDGEILNYGTARIDYLIRESEYKIHYYRKKYRFDNNAYICLYAPTFRKGNSIEAYNIDYKSLIDVIEKKHKKKCIVLLKLHPNLLGIKLPIEDLDNIITMKSNSDLQELMILSDCLITDYSSCMFDAAYINKPCYLYASDFSEYIKKERDVYFDISELPFPLTTNNAELVKAVTDYSEENYLQKLVEFRRKITSYEDGNSCDKLIKKIFERIDGDENEK